MHDSLLRTHTSDVCTYQNHRCQRPTGGYGRNTHMNTHTYNLQTMNINTDVTLMSPQDLDSSKTRETAENRHVRLTFK